MSAPTLLVVGRRVRVLERIGVVGQVLGLTRATAYRIARADDWPLVGPSTSRFVIMPVLLQRLGIPYDVEGDADVARTTRKG